MKNILLLLGFFYISTTAFCVPTNLVNEDEKSKLDLALKAVFGVADYVFDDFESNDNKNGGRNINVTISLFGEGEVELSANYQSERITDFELDFPEDAKFDIEKINQLVDGKLKSYLPDGLPLSAGVNIQSFLVDFGESGVIPKQISTTLGLVANWDLLDNGSFTANGMELELTLINPKESSRDISGELKGNASIGDIGLSIATLLSTNGDDTEITATIEELKLSSLIDAFIPKTEGAALLNATPDLFKNLSLSSVEIGVMPVAKVLNVTANSSLGNVIMGLEKKGGSTTPFLAIQPAESFEFSQLSEVLAPLNNMDFSGSYFILSGKQTQISANFFDKEETDESKMYPVKKGLNMVSSISLPENLTEILKVKDVTLSGAFPTDLAGVSLSADLNFGFSLGDDAILFKRLTAGLFVGKGDFEMSFTGVGAFKADEEYIDIFGGLYLDIISQQVGFSAGLAAGGMRVEAPINCLVAQPEWAEPFGIPGVGIRRLGIGAAIGTTFPWINKIELEGNLRVGTVADQSQHVCGAVTVVANIADFSESMLVAEVQNLTIIKMVEAFVEDSGIEGSLRDAMDTGIESAKLKIVPKEMEVFGRSYTKGVALDSAKLKLLGMNAMLGFSVSESGIKAYGSMDPMIIEEGGFTFFAIQGVKPDAKGNPTGPSVSLGLDESDPHFKLDGSVTVLEIQTDTFIKVDKSGFEFTTTGNVLDGALAVTATISASDFTEDSGIYAKVAFENKLQSMVADELKKFIEEETKKNQATYREAKRVLAESKGNNDFEQFWIDAAGETVNAFQEMDKAAAIAGTYVVEGLLEEALNIRKISFEGSVTSMKAEVTLDIDMTIAGQDIVEQVSLSLNISEDMFVDLIVDAIGEDVIDAFGSLGNEVTAAFEDLGTELESAFEDLGNEIIYAAEVVGEGIITASEYVGDAIIDAAKATEDWMIGSNETNRVDNGIFSAIPPDHTYIQVKVNQITVIKDETDVGQDALSEIGGVFGAKRIKDGLDLFGGISILVSPNVKANRGATPYAYSRSERNRKENVNVGQSISVNHTKDFFVPNNQQGFVQLFSLIGDWNTSGSDTEILFGQDLFQFNSLTVGQTFNRSVKGFNDSGKDEEISINYEIRVVERRGPIPTINQMVAVVKTGNTNEINRLVSDGGTLRGSGMIEAAIMGKNNVALVNRLLSEGNFPKTTQVELALTPQYYNQDIAVTLLRAGATGSSDALLKMAQQNNLPMVKLLANQYGAVPKLAHLQAAMQVNNIEMVKLFNEVANIPVTGSELTYAISKKEISLAKDFIKRGADISPEMFVDAVKINNAELLTSLLSEADPTHAALQEAANQNNFSMFKTLSLRTPLTNNQPIYTAIDKNNMDIVLQGLKHGGTKAGVLQHAIQKNNMAAVKICLDRGANATPAINFALQKNDEPFFSSLLTQYGANATTALMSSYDKNNIRFAQIALENGANANTKLATAAAEGKEKWVTLLLEFKADPNLAIKNAVDNQFVPIVAQLLEAGANGEQQNLIISAASNKNLAIVKLLVEQGGAKAEAARPTSIQLNDVATLLYLLENGAKPTGLKIPSQNGWMPMVKLLVEKGADVNEGMAVSIEYDKDDVAIYLLDNGAKVGGFIATSSKRGDYNVVAKLLEKGADVNAGAFNAVRYKHTNIMKLMIEKGADATKESLMDGAVVNFQLDMVELLLANGGDTKFVTNKQETYLHRVAGKNKMDQLVMVFIKAGLDLEAENKDKETPLLLAVRRGNSNLQAVKNLVENGANVNATDKKGRTVLKRAKGKKVKDYLKEKGALKKLDN